MPQFTLTLSLVKNQQDRNGSGGGLRVRRDLCRCVWSWLCSLCRYLDSRAKPTVVSALWRVVSHWCVCVCVRERHYWCGVVCVCHYWCDVCVCVYVKTIAQVSR